MTVTSALIPASGPGKRLNSRTRKAFVPLLGRPLITHTLEQFERCPIVHDIVLVVSEQDVSLARTITDRFNFSKVRSIVQGGCERQDSVRNGLRAISSQTEIVVIHDGARPLVTQDIIESCFNAARETGAAIAAVPVIDTIKRSCDDQVVECTLDRTRLWNVQTPQAFKRDVIEHAYQQAYAEGFFGTDDASLVERIGLPVKLVRGSYENIKVTTPTDLVVAEAILTKRQAGTSKEEVGMQPRIGYGYDVHRFAPGRKLFLGGVEFESEIGLLGHSDADVLLHALMDAILGAIGLGDIGRLFPDTDPAYKDIRSTDLLARVAKLVNENEWKIGNLDVMLLAERPRIAPRAPEMREVIAQHLGISPEQVSIKASTCEELGFVGKGEGIACHAVALVHRTG